MATTGTVLIAALSGRALAQSARRAGFVPYVVDAFGDLDMREAAEKHVVVPEAMTRGFRTRTLVPALHQLASSAASPPVGLVLGSGFEDKPRLMRVLDAAFNLIGTPVHVIAEINDPVRLSARLNDLGIAHPETVVEPPNDPTGWLSKKRGATGGGHVRYHERQAKARRNRYYQRAIPGERYSVFAIAGRDTAVSAVTRQWSTPGPGMPFRYGGAVRVDDCPGHAAMLDAAAKLMHALPLRGLISFDFSVVGHDAYLLEINARPGATLDLFDSDTDPLFAAHIEASTRGTVSAVLSASDMAASAILYASERAFVMPAIDWPDWAHDRTPPGTRVDTAAPIATVTARAPTTAAAMTLLSQRLAILEGLIYERAKM